MPIRIEASGGLQVGVLPNGFRYGPRSEVQFVLQPADAPRQTAHHYEGTCSISMEASQNLPLKRIIIVLQCTPSKGFKWGAAKVLPEVAQSHCDINTRVVNQQLLFIELKSRGHHRIPAHPLLSFTWQQSRQDTQIDALRMEAKALVALASHGGQLKATMPPAVIHLGQQPSS